MFVKKQVVLLLFILFASVVYGQFDPQMGQYMYMPASYNPAAVGDGNMMRVIGAHRMQYVDITNAPMTTWFSFSSPFVIGKTYHGAGVRFLNDRYGLFTTQSFYAQYAYRQRLGKGYLSVGLDLGFVNVGFKGDSINLGEMGDDTSGNTKCFLMLFHCVYPPINKNRRSWLSSVLVVLLIILRQH